MLVEEQKSDIARLLQGHQEEKERLTEDIKIQVEKERDLVLKKQVSEQFNTLKREHEENLRELQRAHDQETLLLRESYQRSQSSFQETIDRLNSQLKSFQEKMKRVEESILSRDYKKHIQDYGSPSRFWEQELESLHFVIEMKNERIHDLDKKLLNLEMVMERNLLLEEKVKTQTQNHLKLHRLPFLCRQLSDELLVVREALDKESQLREQAHREKEELLYRVLNGISSPAFPVASSEVPLIAT
nr:coiled-coil domain-containing protein 69 [Pelodiscus sinensis]|eukprot:XP_006138313.1 coiled-coil domain-containing protein 69 [Pelodiscus sinensis]